ncbi:MAG: hypothetical protein IPI58_05735 [Alphaproteobacteria bacterium]|nr:MAG: hypothetical protein IPI58_05735 [Alphaproteobacteria bacterium]
MNNTIPMISRSKKNKTHDASLLSWEEEFENLPNVFRVNRFSPDIRYVKEILESAKDEEDSYLTSLAYYLFTGRDGLWGYGGVESLVLVSWHPNLRGRILIFPQLGNQQPNLIESLVQEMPPPPAGAQLARIKPQNAPDAIRFLSDALPVWKGKASLQPEDILDWLYPAHVIDTRLVAEAKRSCLKGVRNNVNRLASLKPEVVGLQNIGHPDMLIHLARRWAYMRDPHRIEELIDPYQKLATMVFDQSLGLQGQAVLIDGKVEAFCVWDPPKNSRGMATGLATLHNPAISGLSDYQYNKMCATLARQGVGLLNLGGSETSGLDWFKRKFKPAHSYPLCSIDIRYHPLSHINLPATVRDADGGRPLLRSRRGN